VDALSGCTGCPGRALEQTLCPGACPAPVPHRRPCQCTFASIAGYPPAGAGGGRILVLAAPGRARAIATAKHRPGRCPDAHHRVAGFGRSPNGHAGLGASMGNELTDPQAPVSVAVPGCGNLSAVPGLGPCPGVVAPAEGGPHLAWHDQFDRFGAQRSAISLSAGLFSPLLAAWS